MCFWVDSLWETQRTNCFPSSLFPASHSLCPCHSNILVPISLPSHTPFFVILLGSRLTWIPLITVSNMCWTLTVRSKRDYMLHVYLMNISWINKWMNECCLPVHRFLSGVLGAALLKPAIWKILCSAHGNSMNRLRKQAWRDGAPCHSQTPRLVSLISIGLIICALPPQWDQGQGQGPQMIGDPVSLWSRYCYYPHVNMRTLSLKKI